MLSSPRVGQLVELRYCPALRALTGLHGCLATVVIVGRGRPRNHGVRLLNGRLVSVSAGNIFPAAELFPKPR